VKGIIEKSIKYENRLAHLLINNGFKIVKSEVYGGHRLRPDFIIEKSNQNYIVELKVQNIVTDRVLFQIAFYKEQYSIDNAYLAIPVKNKISESIKTKLLENNIGIIHIDTDNLTFKEPIKKKNERVLKNKFVEKFEIYQAVEDSNIKLNQFMREFVLYILLGGIFVLVFSEIVNFYFFNNIFAYWAILITCLIIIILLALTTLGKINWNILLVKIRLKK
jgi:hypothetical protein